MAIRRRKRSSGRKLRRLIFIGVGLFIGSYAFWMTNKLLESNEQRQNHGEFTVEDELALSTASNAAKARVDSSIVPQHEQQKQQGSVVVESGGGQDEPGEEEDGNEAEEETGGGGEVADGGSSDGGGKEKVFFEEKAAAEEEKGEDAEEEEEEEDTRPAAPNRPSGPLKSLWDMEVLDIDGNLNTLKSYEGKVALVVNVASKCGFTEANYRGMEPLYKKYKAQGFVVLAFPCNQFGNQEPDDEPAIKTWAQKTYGVDFPMYSKVDVNGDNAHPVYKFLKYSLPPETEGLGEDIKWNFAKFLVNKHGWPVKRYTSDWDTKEIESDIESLLRA